MPKMSVAEEKSGFQKLFELLGCSFTLNGTEAHAEECPFCRGVKFSLNVETGQFQCFSKNKCGVTGNAYSFIDRYYRLRFEETSDAEYHSLRDKRGLPLQTLKRHGLAWDATTDCWLIPYKSEAGKVQNLTRYFLETGDKLTLPGLPLRLYGLDQLRLDDNRTLFVCEGPFDAIALDQHFREKKTRERYDILAVPSANVFNRDWLKHLKGRTVRLLLDNDKAGRDGQERIGKLCCDEKVDCRLSTLIWPSGFPEKCDIADLVRDGVNVAEFARENCVKAATGKRSILFIQGDKIPEERVQWLWEGHVTFGTFVSLSGLMGTQKSTVAKDIAARATAGLPMPNCTQSLAPFDVFYFTSEDSASRVRDLVRIHGGDLTRLQVHDIASGSEPIDLLDCLDEIEATINSRKCRLVILDALNSFVGGEISTDSKARRTLSGRLQSLARRTAACIIGIRNWGKMDAGSASQRSLGATSLSDVARCVMNTRELEPVETGAARHFQLEFEKVSDAPKPKPIPYSVENRSTCEADSHYRKIVWRKPFDPVALKKALNNGRNKGSEKR